MITFTGRERELEALNREFRKDQFSFFPIYGRRRIGKTTLIKEFIKDKPNIFFQCIEGSEKENFENFKIAASKFIDLSPVKEDLENIFTVIVERIEERTVVVLDEYPYLAGSSRGFSSRLQKLIDDLLSDSNIFLILSGSSVRMMYQEVLGSSAPLYGRRTGQIELTPLNFRESVELLNKPPVESVSIRGVCGGVPYYLEQFREDGSFIDLLERKLLDQTTILGKEMEFLLRTELDEVSRYGSIIKAISMGYTGVSKIANYCGFSERVSISPYLKKLENLNLIVKEISVEKNERSRGIYRIEDEFTRFNMVFIRPYQTVEQRRSVIQRDLNRYLGQTFEKLSQEHVSERYPMYRVGRWWHKEEEIDIAAIEVNGNRAMFFECKWRDLDPDEVKRIRYQLNKKIKKIRGLDLENREIEACIIARSFTSEKGKNDIDLEDIYEWS